MSTDRSRRRGPFAATGYALLYLVLWVPAITLFSLTTTGLSLVVIGVGVFVLYLTVPATSGLAALHRSIASSLLGRPVPATYVPTRGAGFLTRLRIWAGDPLRWREYLWTLVDSTVGLIIALVPPILLLAVVWWAVFPIVFASTPSGVFDMQVGAFKIDSIGSSFITWVFAILTGFVWWWTSEPLMRGKAWIDAALVSTTRTDELERRVEEVTTSRAETVDAAAAELRRIERDLHDGAQARLVSLGMSLGLADELMDTDPEAARKLLAEARHTSSAALGDLRSVVRGIHPPVLADRGLAGAVQALAMDMAVPVQVTLQLPGRPPAPVESAVYFATAECLANIGKHSGAAHAWLTIWYGAGRLKVEIGDDGRGGAAPQPGTGMLGVMRRLAAFDGTMSVSSPVGGPTVVLLEVPCELSSPRTTPSSATG